MMHKGATKHEGHLKHACSQALEEKEEDNLMCILAFTNTFPCSNF